MSGGKMPTNGGKMPTDGERPAKVSLRQVSVYYRDLPALRAVDLDVPPRGLLTIMGPTASGKTSVLRVINRMNDLVPGSRHEGRVLVDGEDVYAPGADPAAIRRRVGMVFSLAMPLPLSVYENVAYGPRLQGGWPRPRLDDLVEECLRAAVLWDELKDRLHDPARFLSGGQQQRLAVARCLATRPEVLLLDEPTAGLDPISTLRIEGLLRVLVKNYTVILVTSSPQQAARVGGQVAFFYMGELVERGPAKKLFVTPATKRTEDYISGRFG